MNNFGTIDLNDKNIKTILVKYNFTNKKFIPNGIKQVLRTSDKEIDQVHAEIAIKNGQADEAKEGKIRKNRVDTGKLIIDNALMVQIPNLGTGFANSINFHLTSCHYYIHQKPKSTKKFVVVAEFKKGNSGELSRDTKDAMRELALTTWQGCFGYLNPDGTITLNLNGRKWNDKDGCYFPPQNHLVIRDKKLQVISTLNASVQ